jgi:hypothetical protein
MTFTCSQSSGKSESCVGVDSKLYQTRTPRDLPSGAKWVYDHAFFLLLNLAVGGQWPGNPDARRPFRSS